MTLPIHPVDAFIGRLLQQHFGKDRAPAPSTSTDDKISISQQAREAMKNGKVDGLDEHLLRLYQPKRF